MNWTDKKLKIISVKKLIELVYLTWEQLIT